MLPRVDVKRREIVVPRGGFAMPRVCACCGGRGDRVIVVSGVQRTWFTLAIILAFTAARELSMDLFVCGACVRRNRIRLALGWTAGAAALLTGAGMIGLGDAWILPAMAAMCLGPVLVAAVTIAKSTWPVLHTFDAETVTLRFRGPGVCEAFAQALASPPGPDAMRPGGREPAAT